MSALLILTLIAIGCLTSLVLIWGGMIAAFLVYLAAVTAVFTFWPTRDTHDRDN